MKSPWSMQEIQGNFKTPLAPKKSETDLDYFYGLVKRQILRFQSPTSHLFPDKSSNTTQANLRDSIYCNAAVWSLYQAYKRVDDDRGKRYELGQSVVAGMRGVLQVWMRQSEMLEKWKENQTREFALYTLVGLHTSATPPPHQYNHLQLDVVCLYLLFLVQMITSGLEIIYSMEEVSLVQNLVYYIERSYRTPGFGSWGRGTKYNDGTPEVSASSIGMAKAALEAVNGFNVFGERGSNYSVIYVDIDAHNRNRSIFETLLPRESNTKLTDAALLSTISFPFFATQNQDLYSRTKETVIEHLEGEYGFKRFVGDGFGTQLEDHQRRYYHKGETLEFEKVENEWPIFYINMIIDGLFKNLPDQVKKYKELLKPRLMEGLKSGDPLVPQMYQVGSEQMKHEREMPRSQRRKITNASNPEEVFLCGQAFYVIAELLTRELVHVYEVDPIKRYLPCYARPKPVGRYSSFTFLGGQAASDLVIQVVMISESTRLQCMLANYGIQTQTPTEVEPVQIWAPGELVRVLESMGKSSKLGLRGRPQRPVGSLGTSKLWRVAGKTILCYPLIFSSSEFYLSHDMALLTENIKAELKFISRCWRLNGRPTFCILITEKDMRDPHFDVMRNFLADLRQGHCDGIKVRLGRLQNLLSSSCIEHLDFLSGHEAFTEVTPLQEVRHQYAGYQSLTDIPKALEVHEDLADFAGQYANTSTWDVVEVLKGLGHVYGSVQLLGILLKREGPDFSLGDYTVRERLEIFHSEAGQSRYWAALRYSSSLLQQLIDSISPYVTQIIVNGKTLTVGTSGVVCQEFDTPCSPQEMFAALYTKVQPYNIIGAVMQQELILYCGKLIATQPDLFNGILVLRMSWFTQAIVMFQSFVNPEEAAVPLENLPPSQLLSTLTQMLSETVIENKNGSRIKNKSNLTQRQISSINGCLIRVPENFYPSVYNILKRCPGGLTFGKKHLPQQSTLKMEAFELNFFRTIESFLVQYVQSDTRFLIIRLLVILSTVLTRNPEITYRKELVIDNLIIESLRLYHKEAQITPMETETQLTENTDLRGLLELEPAIIDSYIARAIVNMLLGSEIAHSGTECRLQ